MAQAAGETRARAAGVDLLLATGGSGGHAFPALAVAQEALKDGRSVVVLGAKGGMEEGFMREAGVPFVGVRAGKWHRGRPSPAQAARAALGVLDAVMALRRLKPGVVVGFGGFASFPGAAAAALLGVPLALHEGNAYPSQVNRWLSRRAGLVVSAQEEALRHLKGVKRSLVLPFPVREVRVDRGAAREKLGLPQDAVVTLVMGGSQGSATLNREAPSAFARLGAHEGHHHVLHSAGRGRSAEVDATGPNYHVHDFLDAALAWSAADLAITRAGVGTLSEAAFHGVPTVMVPLPSSAEDHQLHNALAVQTAGAGVLVEEKDIAERLAGAWRSLLEPSARDAAARAAAARTPEGAARRILCAVLEQP
ncbi:MAG TPA: UDP-N-acetylglucosamine--N-acetylmuramyl-(pentapeptide) pyrophosphoryl-undecaprenol N-acetylglucosamine transferase [Trueperaceae bacterium]